MKKLSWVLLGLLVLLFAGLFFTKPFKVISPYPQVTKLASTQNLICEEVMISGIGAADRCDRKNSWGYTKMGKIEHLQEGMRIGSSDKIIHKDAWDKRRIKLRREEDMIYMLDEKLIKELEESENEKRFKKTYENEDKLIAFFSDENRISTSAATLFLDKQKGLLIYSDTESYLFCNESLTNRTILYSCKEN